MRRRKNYASKMATPRASLAVTLASILSFFTLLIARPASAEPCFEAISSTTAQAIFDGLVKLKSSDACALENVATERAQVRVEWKQDGRILEAILVVPTSCVIAPKTRGTLSTIVPASVAAACPAAADATESLVEELGARALVAVNAGTSVPVVVGQAPSHRGLHRRVLAEGVGALAVSLVALLALRRWRRWRALHPSPVVLPVARDGPGTSELPETKTRPRWQRNPTRAGWGAALLLAPHLALGTWLLVVPDHVAFTAAQIVTLAHVTLALLAIPFVGLSTYVHVRRMRTTRPRSRASTTINRVLAAAVLVAAGTGLAVVVGGDIVRLAPLHAACGVAVGVPLALHLWWSPRRGAAVAVAATLGVTTVAALAARRWLPATAADANVPAFDYTTRDASLYEPAASCGECHVQDYADWKRSTHARTLELPNVQESLGHSKDILGETLTHIGALRTAASPPATAAVRFSACGSCHAPTTFYGDDKQSMLAPAGVVSEGVGCSFCHTLRAVHESPRAAGATALSSGDVFGLMSRVPLYVSAPETVRRYLFQRSRRPLARRLANLLIRWRPAVHSRDYESPVMHDSRACLACHSLGVDVATIPHMTYFGWKASSFVTADAATTVECQDCHMTEHVTGAPTHDHGRMVPWGPVRATRSHLLLGGNVHAAETLGDADLARREHALNAAALTLTISSVHRVADVVEATVAVHSNLVGHFFPAFETQLRYGWIELEVMDAAGKLVASTAPPRDSQDFGAPSPFIMASSDDPKSDNQRLVGPRASREFRGHVALPKDAAVETLVALLHVAVDPTPIASGSRPIANGPPLP